MDRVSSGGTTKIRYRDFIKHCEHSGLFVCPFHPQRVPVGSAPRGEDVTINVYDINPPSLPTPFNSVLVSVFFSYGSFNYISFHKFSQKFPAFSLCSPSLISALLVLSTVYLFVKVFCMCWLWVTPVPV